MEIGKHMNGGYLLKKAILSSGKVLFSLHGKHLGRLTLSDREYLNTLKTWVADCARSLVKDGLCTECWSDFNSK